MKKKVYIEMNCEAGEISIENETVWDVDFIDWFEFESILLTNHQKQIQDENFSGWIEYGKYIKAKELYESKYE